jgi:hypothetical protein
VRKKKLQNHIDSTAVHYAIRGDVVNKPLLFASKSRRHRFAEFVHAACLFTVLGLVTGCVTANFTQPVASFQKSVNTSSAAIGSYFTNLNEFERQLYLDDLALNPGKKLEATDKNGQPTPLLGQYFQAASIKARMDSLLLLGVYGQRLSELAGSNAPQQFSDNAKALGTSLTDLDKTFSQLAKTPDKSAAAYIGPVSALVGSLGKIYLERQRDQAIIEAVNNGAPAVRTILLLLEQDLVKVIKPLQETGLEQELAERVGYYNEHRDNGIDFKGRVELLTDVHAYATAYEAALAFNPSGLIQSMRQAHDALVKYANAPRTPQNFDELVVALQTFDQSAQEVGKEVELIRQATKGK